jgi:hypothetical protein
MVEALANNNPTPVTIGHRHKPLFDENFDWNENSRARNSIPVLILNVELAWPQLVSHLGDERYCTTYKSFSGSSYNRTVGDICREIVLRNLSNAYFETVHFTPKEVFLNMQTASFLRDPKILQRWCADRHERKLYELQIEMCEWAQKALAEQEEFAQVDADVRSRWSDAISDVARRLHEAKAAILWRGFGPEEIAGYTQLDAEAIRRDWKESGSRSQ